MIMSLNGLLSIPEKNARGIATWLFWHANDHLEIVQAIAKTTTTKPPVYVLDPANPDDVKGWALTHQQAHNDMNSALGLQGSDLTSIDFSKELELKAWLFINFMEHAAARQTIGI